MMMCSSRAGPARLQLGFYDFPFATAVTGSTLV
jgi:hypothetical protein